MSEVDPLLSSHIPPETEEPYSWKEWAAEHLESPALHKTVIALARILVLIDSACVLADLGYTFLNETCTPDEENQPLWLTILAHISLAITAFFLVEIPINIWAFGWTFYRPGGRALHSSLHFFDAVVIATTFIFEVVLRGRERELASLLIILRLWRLVKLVQGIAVSAGELEEGNARKLEETERELEGVIVALADTREENHRLRERIRTLESSS
ncbi:predicted protein [Postia placenta Mad-698-R]|uniref:Voltage-gated hydrogen channel 1 n=2 Tax=Rhodonia placenta TaxID=104341 RepID=A0A1X6N9J4_9APHY|nr:hypothetical protein POSPLADRAFT_1044463 [Postia placenta MAD-698-R-SB12]EED84189.1 predicted protein [Postia placenta Mad-698-R]KAF9821384.1 hypothetical protein IEO21_00630 [Postia placenta]OSX65043.1 hypothetical protein POSPLADRAFT_1044463 [Postia placenta MAD-698-R-SB12]